MKKSLLRHLTRPIRSPIGTRHRCFRNRSKPDSCRSGPLNHDQNRLFRSVWRHRSEIMFGVLVVVFRGDGVAVLGFSSRECQIPLIVSLGIGRARRCGPGTRRPRCARPPTVGPGRRLFALLFWYFFMATLVLGEHRLDREMGTRFFRVGPRRDAVGI